jgi:hypothetical protein
MDQMKLITRSKTAAAAARELLKFAADDGDLIFFVF